MNIRAGLGEHILQTHNTNFLKIQWGGGLNPQTPALGMPVAVSGGASFFKWGGQKGQDILGGKYTCSY